MKLRFDQETIRLGPGGKPVVNEWVYPVIMMNSRSKGRDQSRVPFKAPGQSLPWLRDIFQNSRENQPTSLVGTRILCRKDPPYILHDKDGRLQQRQNPDVLSIEVVHFQL